MIILTPKNAIFERFWPLSKFHFPACSTLIETQKQKLVTERELFVDCGGHPNLAPLFYA